MPQVLLSNKLLGDVLYIGQPWSCLEVVNREQWVVLQPSEHLPLQIIFA